MKRTLLSVKELAVELEQSAGAASLIIEADLASVFPGGRPSRGYRHLFPLPSAGGPCKRLHLFLRWMVRREAPDFGLWTGVSPARLLIPLDTHVENMSRAIGLTRRRSRNWRMAQEVTQHLALVDAEDPVKFDFALCHKRMSGDCRDRRDPIVCQPCGLRTVCRHWPERRAAGPGRQPTRDDGRGERRARAQERRVVPETIARFLREGRTVAKIRHPHVIDVFDVGTHEGTPYLVMDLLEGESLDSYLAQPRTLSLVEVTEIMIPIIAGVAAAHEMGIIHNQHHGPP